MAFCLVRLCQVARSVGHVWNPQLGHGTTRTPSLSLFWSQLLAHLKRGSAPTRTTPPPPTPSSHPRCFQPSFQNSMPSLLRPGWLFSPSCLEYSGILCSSKVEKRRSSPPYVYLFLNSDNHPAGGFLTEERRCILETDRLEPCLCDLW